jgi:hypothetical protein
MKYENHTLSYERPVVVLDIARELARKIDITEFKIYSQPKVNGSIKSYVHGGACITSKPSPEAIYFTLEYLPNRTDIDPRFSSVKELKVSGSKIDERLVREALDALGGN